VLAHSIRWKDSLATSEDNYLLPRQAPILALNQSKVHPSPALLALKEASPLGNNKLARRINRAHQTNHQDLLRIRILQTKTNRKHRTKTNKTQTIKEKIQPMWRLERLLRNKWLGTIKGGLLGKRMILNENINWKNCLNFNHNYYWWTYTNSVYFINYLSLTLLNHLVPLLNLLFPDFLWWPSFFGYSLCFFSQYFKSKLVNLMVFCFN
jgi:hypothetical protein